MSLNYLIKILVCLGITAAVLNIYMFIVMACFGKLSEAIRSGSSALIGIITLIFFPFYRKEALNIWENIKQNFMNRKGR